MFLKFQKVINIKKNLQISTEISGKLNELASTPTVEKKTAKKYGSKLDTTGSPSRSRSATKELIRK